MKLGKLTAHGVKLEPHELETVAFFLNLGKDVELIKPSNTPNTKRADIFMDGLEWEIKSPTKADKRTIERCFYQACKQSCNIVIDLRRIFHHGVAISTLKKCYQHTRKIRNMCILTKDGEFEIYKK